MTGVPGPRSARAVARRADRLHRSWSLAFVSACLLSAALIVPARLGGWQDAPVQGATVRVNQEPPPSSSSISGVATSADGGRPLAGVVVSLRGSTASTRGTRQTLSDSSGRFVFGNVQPGTYVLEAKRPGFFDGALGRRRPRGPSLTMVIGEHDRRSGVTLALWPHAAISGTVVDEHGEAMPRVGVRALRQITVAGLDRLVLGPATDTDDRGMFRIGGLEAGTYVVCVCVARHDALRDTLAAAGPSGVGLSELLAAMPDLPLSPVALAGAIVDLRGGVDDLFGSAGVGQDGRPLIYQTQFYPASASVAGASRIDIAAGADQDGVTFHLSPVPAHRIHGRLIAPAGSESAHRVTLLAAEPDGTAAPIETATTFADPSGEFEFRAVPSGPYILRVVSQPRPSAAFATSDLRGGDPQRSVLYTVPSRPTLLHMDQDTVWTDHLVSVADADVVDEVVPLHPAIHVRVQLSFLGTHVRPSAEELAETLMVLQPAGDSHINATRGAVSEPCDATSICVVRALPGPAVLRIAGLPSPWVLRTATLEGRDVADVPFDLTRTAADHAPVIHVELSDRSPLLVGSVAKDGDQAPSSFTVVAFPTNRDFWRTGVEDARRFRSIPVRQNGTFSFAELPAGQYFVAAIQESADDWRNPRILERLFSVSTTVTLIEASTSTVALRVVRP